MKHIMQEYGTAMLSAAVALILFAFIYGGSRTEGENSLFSRMGERSYDSKKEYSEYLDAKETKTAMERERPSLFYRNLPVSAGEKLQMQDYFEAEDAEGGPADIEVVKAEDPSGQELAVEDGNIQFGEQGIYRIWVKATDRYCGVTQRLFCIPVMRDRR